MQRQLGRWMLFVSTLLGTPPCSPAGNLTCSAFILRTREAGDDIIQPIQSARIHTKKSFSFTYGIVEVRAKMPKGDWIWPGKKCTYLCHLISKSNLLLYYLITTQKSCLDVAYRLGLRK